MLGSHYVTITGAGDLRVHDHAGLAAAASAGAVRGLFVFDTDLLRLSSDRSVVPFSPSSPTTHNSHHVSRG